MPTTRPFPVEPPFRLPHTFEPSRYRVRLEIGEHQFLGHIEIEGNISEEVSLIWLHGVDLIVKRATASHGDTVVPLEFAATARDQVIGFRSKSPLATGRWTLAIDYSGPIREQEPPINNPYAVRGGPEKVDPPSLGIFRRVIGASSYIYTQSEPIYARRIFPCIDEPDRKVPWQLTLDVGKDLLAASNTTIVREGPIGQDHKRVEFAETRPLPSYLVAFAIGPFDVVEAVAAKSGTPIRILAPRGRSAAVAASAQLAPRILDLLESWFEIQYPYGKLDLVSLPHAGFGAMENPGLVTFSDDVLEGNGDAAIISHELAHQWFGDLVTLSWWDDIWLNESFAVFMSQKMDARLASTEDDTSDSRMEALSFLGREGHVRHEIRSLDALTFGQFAPHAVISRGTSILQLAEAYLGPEQFRIAMRAYLTAHAHGSVDTAELIHVISEAAGKPIETTITNLLDQPVVSLEPKELCDGPARIHFAEVSGPVPVCVAYERDGKRAETCAIVDENAHDIPLPGKGCPRWVMPNAGGIGLYRTKWTKPIVDELLARAWSSLTAIEKLMLFGETTDEALRLSIFLKLIDANDWRATPMAAEYLSSIARYIPGDLRARFDAWVVARYGARAREMHFKVRDGNGVDVSRQQASIVNLVALTQDPQLATEAAQIAAHFPKREQDDWFTGTVLGLAANADPRVRDTLFTELSAHDPMTRYTALSALARVRNLVAIVKADPSKLDGLGSFDGPMLFVNVCDPTDRKALATLAQSDPKNRLGEVLNQVDRCIATRNRLEPDLRRWLAKTK